MCPTLVQLLLVPVVMAGICMVFGCIWHLPGPTKEALERHEARGEDNEVLARTSLPV